MRLLFLLQSVVLLLLITAQPVYSQSPDNALATPPFWGTIFLDPDIITPSDPTTFQTITYTGQGSRTMFDRRVNNWITVNAYLFDAEYDDGLSIEVQVNPEFGSSANALIQAEKYATVIGRLPTSSRQDVQTVWIHDGVQGFGGGNNNLLIHIGQGALYEADGILEETFVHESSHTSLDADHAASPGWLAAQTADTEFISVYAHDNPTREDVAESFLTWLAVRHRAGRISTGLADTITQTIPNRMAYFDAQSFNLYPITPATGIEQMNDEVPGKFALYQNYPNPFNPETKIRFEVPDPGFVSVKVFNVLGEGVATLANSQFNAGSYTVTFDGKNLVNGVYFYRIQTEGFTETRKLLLMK